MKKATSKKSSRSTKTMGMNISIHMNSQSQPVNYTNVVNAYTKDSMYCVYTTDGMVHKYPNSNIFRVIETY